MAEGKYYLEKHGFWDFTTTAKAISAVRVISLTRTAITTSGAEARDNGWRHLVPISPGTKACYVPGWDRWGRVEPTDDEIRHGYLATRVRTGPRYRFRLRPQWLAGRHRSWTYEDGNDVNRRLRYLAENVPGTPMIRVGKGPGCQIYYRAGPTAYGRQCGPEIFFQNKQTVLFGQHPITGRPYKWKGGSPATRKLSISLKSAGNDLDGFLMRFGHDRIPGDRGGL